MTYFLMIIMMSSLSLKMQLIGVEAMSKHPRTKKKKGPRPKR